MSTEERIYKSLYSVINDESIEITPDSVITSDLGISSFNFMQVIYNIETDFSIEITEAEMENFIRVQDLIDCVSE